MHTIQSLFNLNIDRLAGRYPVGCGGRCRCFYEIES